ncbi:hypothetical protein DFJ73DRAFT_768246 [Zopfochytrium polystomum]|nr:hypothetical protein DFJ73DRAFT_768246 [Zopfochytrium polystomum]
MLRLPPCRRFPIASRSLGRHHATLLPLPLPLALPLPPRQLLPPPPPPSARPFSSSSSSSSTRSFFSSPSKSSHQQQQHQQHHLSTSGFSLSLLRATTFPITATAPLTRRPRETLVLLACTRSTSTTTTITTTTTTNIGGAAGALPPFLPLLERVPKAAAAPLTAFPTFLAIGPSSYLGDGLRLLASRLSALRSSSSSSPIRRAAGSTTGWGGGGKWSGGNRYRRSGSWWRWQPDEQQVVFGIIGLNAAVFLAWRMAFMAYEQGDPRNLRFMEQNFYSSWDALLQGRWWTLVTCAFSHNQFIHFGILVKEYSLYPSRFLQHRDVCKNKNMFVLHSFGRAAIDLLGIPRFITFYLGAAIASSLAHVLYTRFLQPALSGSRVSPFHSYSYSHSHGASGCILASTLLFALAHPRARVALFFVIEVPAIAAVAALVAYDAYSAFKGGAGALGVDHAGHLGGAVFGALYWLLRIRRGGRGGGRRW